MNDKGRSLEWHQFFNELEHFEMRRAEQKRLGVNDYCMLASVLSVNDEVRLHTRFIYSLLDPAGKHYQGSTFIELLLQQLGLEGWLRLPEVRVEKEYCPLGRSDQIDLYITDGERQIIIENKLNAEDQPQQVARYLAAVDTIERANYQDTLFVYLTKGRDRPSSFGLGPDLSIGWQDGTRVLMHKTRGPIALYQNLSYRHHTSGKSIHGWLNACQSVLEPNSHLAFAIKDYRSAVERATGEYQNNVTSLRKFLEQGIADGKDHHLHALELMRELPKIHAHWLDQSMTIFVDQLLKVHSDSAMRRVLAEDAELLRPFISSQSYFHGREEELFYSPKFNFFRDGVGTKNRGAFLLAEATNEREQVLVMMFYGGAYLHVGYAQPLSTSCPEIPTMPTSLSAPAALRKNIFPTVVTMAEKLDGSAILHLADFSSSPQKALLVKMLVQLQPRITTECSDLADRKLQPVEEVSE